MWLVEERRTRRAPASVSSGSKTAAAVEWNLLGRAALEFNLLGRAAVEFNLLVRAEGNQQVNISLGPFGHSRRRALKRRLAATVG